MPKLSVASTEIPPKLPKPGGETIRKRISSTEMPPSTATTEFIETGGSNAESMRRSTATPIAATIVTTRTTGMKSSVFQALPPPDALPEKPPTPETSTPNQLKNMNMKSRTAETAAIFSPVPSLSASICVSLPSD